ncbi:MAG: hypothetical protein PHY48_09520 [Candidatus Cloacimonetes bacterium]|nr:hypothetical protein [Candidatus Cloacimonadota bacterium]
MKFKTDTPQIVVRILHTPANNILNVTVTLGGNRTTDAKAYNPKSIKHIKIVSRLRLMMRTTDTIITAMIITAMARMILFDGLSMKYSAVNLSNMLISSVITMSTSCPFLVVYI